MKEPLFRLFTKEKVRLQDTDIKVFYNKEKQTLGYSKGTEQLLVAFENGREFFSYQNKTSYPTPVPVQQIDRYGDIGYIREAFWDMSDDMIKLAQSYQYERNALWINKYYKEKLKRSDYER
jgi:uncharacterized protein YehS (DUF1456 family)